MSHHHHRQPEKSQTNEPQTVDSGVRPVLPFLSKSDVPYLALIKPLLSPPGQKIVDLLIIFSGNVEPNDMSLNIPALLSQFNAMGENNSFKEMLNTIISGLGGENQSGLNPAIINSLMTLLNTKKETEKTE